MKTVKRILAIISLAVFLWAVGYLVFTGSRLPSVSTEEVIEDITADIYEGSATDEEKTNTSDL